MAENNKKKRIEIEDKIKEILSGDTQKNALNFAAFLRENDISLDYNANESDPWSIWNGAVGGIVGNSIGYITINGGEKDRAGPWCFWFNSCDFDGSDSADDEFKNAIWAFASPCGRCNENWEKCMGSGKRTILGKEFENQCHSPLMFCNPDAETVEHMKKFLLYLKPEIDKIQAEVEREKAIPPNYITNPNFKTNLTNLRSNDTEWIEEDDGAYMWGFSGDRFVFSDTQATDFEYEADIIIEDGQAAMLAFRADQYLSKKYFANIDMSGVVKLIKPGTEICVAEADIKRGVKYHMKVCANGSNIKVYLDGELKIDADDDSCKSGYFGVGVFNAKALFQNVNAEIKSI